MRRKNLLVGASFVAVLSALGAAQLALQKTTDAQAKAPMTAPRFEVDPMWPKPLPNGWYLGQTIGVGVDANDHVWIIHRQDSLDTSEAAADEGTGSCCHRTPPILEFDQAGNLLRHWVAKVSLDNKANEAYLADGYGNKRVAVIDMDTGKIKRYWGAYGHKPDDAAAAAMPRYTPGSTPSQQFRGPVHCAEPSNDGLIYVCDRTSDRLQIFNKDGSV